MSLCIGRYISAALFVSKASAVPPIHRARQTVLDSFVRLDSTSLLNIIGKACNSWQ